jgi:glycerol-3-phosphate dehydrogenase
MLNHMLHATTMNRDGDPARLDEDIAFDAFDAGAAATDQQGAAGESTGADGGPGVDDGTDDGADTDGGSAWQ